MSDTSRERNAPGYPNVLWIGVDQMRADTPGYTGNEICQTPNLDRLAGEGVSFSRAYTPASQCSPARASMLTGRYAFHHGVGTNCDMYHGLAAELPHPEELLHYRLQARGYRCGYAGKWHVGTDKGPVDYGFEGMNLPGYGDLKRDAGFQGYLKERGLSYGPVESPIYGNADETTLLGGRWNGPLESTPTYYLADYAIDLLDTFAADDRPFFLTCQFWAPHPPYLPSPEYAGRHDRSSISPWPNFRDDLREKPESLRRFRRDFYRALPTSWEGWRELVGLYYDYVALVDAQIGRVVDRLDALGVAEDTLVVFTSDHGDMNGAHGGLFDKGFMYEEAHRVPLVIRCPKRFEGGASGALVYNMDIFPTLLELVGEPLDGLDGRSLLPFLQNPDAPGREALLLESHGMRHLYSQRALVTEDGYKYIFNPGHEDEVYDLNMDPGELRNLLRDDARRARVAELQRRLIDVAIETRDPLKDYVAKLFGRWRGLSGQPDASAAFVGSEVRG